MLLLYSTHPRPSRECHQTSATRPASDLHRSMASGEGTASAKREPGALEVQTPAPAPAPAPEHVPVAATPASPDTADAEVKTGVTKRVRVPRGSKVFR